MSSQDLTAASVRNLAHSFWKQVCTRPTTTALFQPTADSIGAWTWADLGQRVALVVRQLETQLYSHRSAEITVVGSHLPNSVNWLALELACQTLGVVHAAIDSRFSTQQARAMAAQADAAVVWGQQDVAALEGRAFPDAFIELSERSGTVDAASPACVTFTSGSSGNSAGIVHSASAIVHNAIAKLDAAPQYPSDLRMNVLPFSHAYARTCELATWLLSGGQIALCPEWQQFPRLCQELNPTLVNLVPLLAERVAEMLDNEPECLGQRLRLLQVGGAALSASLWQRLARHGLPPIQGYGLTEAGPVVCSGRAGSQKQGDVGFPVQGVCIRTGHNGQLYVKGPSLLNFRVDGTIPLDPNGWLPTGDVATIDATGRVTIQGRLNRRITLSNGLNVDPLEVENRLEQWPAIEYCIVGLYCCVGQQPNSGDSTLTAWLWLNPSLQFGPAEWLAAKESLSDLPGYAVPAKFIVNACPLSEELFTVKGTLRKPMVLDHIRRPA